MATDSPGTLSAYFTRLVSTLISSLISSISSLPSSDLDALKLAHQPPEEVYNILSQASATWSQLRVPLEVERIISSRDQATLADSMIGIEVFSIQGADKWLGQACSTGGWQLVEIMSYFDKLKQGLISLEWDPSEPREGDESHTNQPQVSPRPTPGSHLPLLTRPKPHARPPQATDRHGAQAVKTQKIRSLNRRLSSPPLSSTSDAVSAPPVSLYSTLADQSPVSATFSPKASPADSPASPAFAPPKVLSGEPPAALLSEIVPSEPHDLEAVSVGRGRGRGTSRGRARGKVRTLPTVEAEIYLPTPRESISKRPSRKKRIPGNIAIDGGLIDEDGKMILGWEEIQAEQEKRRKKAKLESTDRRRSSRSSSGSYKEEDRTEEQVEGAVEEEGEEKNEEERLKVGEPVFVRFPNYSWWPAVILDSSTAPPETQGTRMRNSYLVKSIPTGADHRWVPSDSSSIKAIDPSELDQIEVGLYPADKKIPTSWKKWRFELVQAAKLIKKPDDLKVWLEGKTDLESKIEAEKEEKKRRRSSDESKGEEKPALESLVSLS